MLDEWWRSSDAVVNEIQPSDRGAASSSVAFVNATLVHAFFSWTLLSVADRIVRWKVSQWETRRLHSSSGSSYGSLNDQQRLQHTHRLCQRRLFFDVSIMKCRLCLNIHNKYDAIESSPLIMFVFWIHCTVSRILQALGNSLEWLFHHQSPSMSLDGIQRSFPLHRPSATTSIEYEPETWSMAINACCCHPRLIDDHGWRPWMITRVICR